MSGVPLNDKRTKEQLLLGFLSRVPMYFPELKMNRKDDPAMALVKIYLEMFSDVLTQFNKMPEKALIAFLDVLGIDLMQAQSAKTWVIFTATPEAPENAIVPKGSAVAGTGKDNDGKEQEAVFQTLRDVSVSPAVLSDIVSINALEDSIFIHTDEFKKGNTVSLFRGSDVQEHIFYIGHSDFLNIATTVTINIDFLLTAGVQKNISSPSAIWLVWEYFNGKTWARFDSSESAKSTDTTNELKNSGKISISKNNANEIGEIEINKIKNRWIRCRSTIPLTSALPVILPVIETLSLSVTADEIEPEMLFNNNLPLDVGTKTVKLKGIDAGELWLVKNETIDDSDSGTITIGTSKNGSVEPENGDIFQFENGSKWIINEISGLEWNITRTTDSILVELKDCKLGEAIKMITAFRGNSNHEVRFSVGDSMELPENHLIHFSKLSDSINQDAFSFVVKSIDKENKIVSVILTNIKGHTKKLDPVCEGDPVYFAPYIKPFDEVPLPGNIVTIASDEAFSKKGAYVTIEFIYKLNSDPSKPKEQIAPVLVWEYWNGKTRTWRKLDTIDATNGFTAQCDTSEWKKGELCFCCPEDIAKVKVHGEEKYWIRARIREGDYGKTMIPGEIDIPLFDKYGEPIIDNGIQRTAKVNGMVPGAVQYPILKKITISYTTAKIPAQHCITSNNADYLDVTDEAKNEYTPFKPFRSLPEEKNTLFFGFDKKLTGGPLRLLLTLEKESGLKSSSKSQWYFWNGTTWKDITVTDTTNAFHNNGYIEFYGSREFTSSELFGLPSRFWLKTDILGGGFPDDLAFKNIYFNAVEVIQSSLVVDEQVGASNGLAHQKFEMLHSPVIEQEVWVRESHDEEIIKNFKIDEEYKEVKDNGPWDGQVWVRWNAVDDFDDSDPDKRHYRIDRRTGTIFFGNNVKGMIPPKGTANIKVSYRYGGGIMGNVAADSITALKSSIVYLKSVTNPFRAEGGAEAEKIEQTIIRGASSLQHRNRAVTACDFEQMAKVVSRAVARARCLMNIDDEDMPNAGWVSILIIPDTDKRPPEAGQELISNVKNGLEKVCVGTIGKDQRLSIRNPDYLKVCVEATLIPKSADSSALIVKNAVKELNTFLDPLCGGSDKMGWEFGGTIRMSAIITILEKIQDVDYTKECRLRINGIIYYEDYKLKPNQVVYSGTHSIDLSSSSEKTIPIINTYGCRCAPEDQS